MKSPILGLALSTVAFGASTLYLGVQLSAVQEQADATAKANAELTTRIVELQRKREEIARQQRVAAMSGAAPHDSGVYVPGGGSGPGAPPPDGKAAIWTTSRRDPVNPPPMPEAMVKMMRANLRAQNKRMYFDLQSKLGLTDDQTSDLLDLITEQHTGAFKGPQNLAPEQAREWWEAEQARRKTAIEDLLGPAKVVAFEEYQKSMPARSELMMISQQLEGAETPLDDTQRSRLLDAMVAERDRIPMPTFAEGTSPEDSTRAYADWQSDYDKRVADAARAILTSDQFNTYSEYQQWQRELRQQFATQGPGGGPRFRGNAAFLPGGPVNAVSIAIGSAPSPTEKPADSK
jgi:hypothetical protein